MSTLARILRTVAIPAILLVMFVSPALAGDKIILKDGRILEGEITRERAGYIWITAIVNGVEQDLVLRPNEIESIQRDLYTPDADTTDEADEPATVTDDQERRLTSATKRAAVISFGGGGDKDMVGIYATADSFRNAIPLLEEENIDVLVIEFNSGGGALLEIQKLSDVIQYELKPKFEVKAWIRYCISAAAMSAHAIEEIYFMPQGAYGACTGWFGNLTAVSGRGLEEVLYQMEKISARGGYDPAIMRAMQINEPLSATIDPDTGEIEWYQSELGENLVNEGTEILTFTSDVAQEFGFSKGTAADLDQLTRAMGYTELIWVGEEVEGIAYPVCRAEKYLRDFREKTYRDEQKFVEYVMGYQEAIAYAQGMPLDDRGKFVNRARQFLQRLASMVKNNPNLALFQLNMMPEQFPEWYQQQEEFLRDLMNPNP